jgi:uncharacterized cupin superfamily protein
MMRVWKPSDEEINRTNQWATWNKEISEFTWFYDDTETCYITQGEAIVTDKNGNEIHFKQGDMVRFEEGLECTWKIVNDIHKRYLFG